MIGIIGIVLIFTGFLISIVLLIASKNNHNVPSPKKNNGKYAILIPARNESKVIEDLLISIENQTKKIKAGDVYVIVEDKNDPTISIAHKHKMKIVFKKDLSLRRKGYALNDAVVEILDSGKKYDAYFIMDADNVLDVDFVKNMEKSINAGYDIGIGYRNCKNGNDSVVAAASALTFSMINELSNRKKLSDTRTLTISGTGFYIRGELLENLGGYPFHSLTEDYELTLYAVLNNLTTTYNCDAKFYDEQPILYSRSITQRTRWIKGYFEARRKYVRSIRGSITKNDKNFASKLTEVVGVRQYILMVIGAVLYLISKFADIVIKADVVSNVIRIVLFSLLIYMALVIFTAILFILEDGKLNLSRKMKIKALFFNPIFLAGYVRCAVIALFNKNLGWEVIEHNRNLEKK